MIAWISYNIDSKNWTYSSYILELRLIKFVDGEEHKINTQIYKKGSQLSC